MTLLLCLCIVAGTTYCGYAAAGIFRRREEVLGQVLRLISRLKDELCFYRRRLPEALTAAAEETEALSELLRAFVAGLEGREVPLPDPGLKEGEFARLRELLTSLGRSDAGRTGELLTRAEEDFSRFRQEAGRERKRLASMYVKLGFTAGLLLCVVLL